MPPPLPALSSPEAAGLPPGVYERLPEARPQADVRLDVAAFIGLCERGPVAGAVAVDSLTELVQAFGRPGGGRQLPDAVRLFFANGGRRAVVVRAVGPGATRAVLRFDELATPVRVEARDPGVWGDSLQLAWQWLRRPLLEQPDGSLEVPSETAPAVGTCLWCTETPAPGHEPEQLVRFVEGAVRLPTGRTRLLLDDAVPPVPAGAVRSPWEELRGRLVVRWAGALEDHRDLALDPEHPRWVGAALDVSRLVQLEAAAAALRWAPGAGALVARGAFTEASRAVFDVRGQDDAANTGRSLFLEDDTLAALDAWDAASETEPVALVALPDLLHLETALTPVVDDDGDGGSTRFATCVPPDPPEPTAPVELEWPLLAASHAPGEVDALQAVLVEHCDARRRMALLDVPPARDAGALLRWRVDHASGRAAAYAPWLRIARGDLVVANPPCGAVAGIIARTPVHAAPANVPLAGILGLQDDPLLPDAGFLHQERINALRVSARGLQVMGARTTSVDPDWTHIGVRRVVDWLARQLALDARWAVFEPNDRRLWRRLVRMTERRLAAVGAAGGWAGSGPADSWFVRCDETTTPQAERDAGRVVVQVGVAPAVPAEFIVFELALVVGDARG